MHALFKACILKILVQFNKNYLPKAFFTQGIYVNGVIFSIQFHVSVHQDIRRL